MANAPNPKRPTNRKFVSKSPPPRSSDGSTWQRLRVSLRLWHDPGQTDTTRVTAGTGGYEVRAFRETIPSALAKDAPADTVYEVVLFQGDKLSVVGFFDGPPPLDALLAFFASDARFAIDADIDLKTHKVTVYRPY